MAISRRSGVAIGVLATLIVLVAAGAWYESRRTAAATVPTSVVATVTSEGDRGPGTLREALFIAAAAKQAATISVQVKRILLETTLPPIVNPQGVSIVGQPEGAEIDASALQGAAVLDVAGPNTSIEGLAIRHCKGAGVLLRATRFRLTNSTIEDCDVGVDVAENASDVLLERNKFVTNRIGVRFAASSRNTSVLNNQFSNDKDAGLWAVRSTPDSGDSPIAVRDNKLSASRTGMVIGNVSVLVERNEIINAREVAVHVVGSGGTVRGNRINGGSSMGVIAEGAKAAIIDNNEIEGLQAYGVMVRQSSNTLVRNNRMHNCAYGMAFVLGDPQSPSTAVENTILEPKFNGIDIIGDSPILRRNQVVRPRALALHVEDFQPPQGQKVRSKPFLDGNTFGPAATVAAGNPPPANGTGTSPAPVSSR